MLNIGPQELLLILVIALIVVGPTRLPELGRSIGKGLREIRKAQDEVKRTIQVNLDEPATGKGPKPRTRSPGTGTTVDPASGEGSSIEAVPAVAGTEDGAEVAALPSAIAPDPVPLAAEPPPASEVSEISRTLGRSLAELRRAREEVQRGFRVDLGETPNRPSPAEPPAESPRGTEPQTAVSPDESSTG
jgi:Tat protein translocase TatB subunit